MDYEKLHKETINRLQQMVSCGKITVETACGICADFVPESEDEKIRKELIKFVKVNIPDEERYITWLKKQGEQKPAEWSEEDEVRINRIVACLENLNVSDNDILLKDVDWLKSLKDRVQPQRESDERNKFLGKLEEWLDEYVSDLADVDTATLIGSFTNYLDGKLPKSIRPQKQWKPSDEQMTALRQVISGCSYDIEPLVEIEEYLKKLKE